MDIYFHLLAYKKFIEMHGSKNVKHNISRITFVKCSY
jgi:hypothetical protein